MTEQASYEGGCLCGALRYRVLGPLSPLVYCHCSQCRKAQGSAFAANIPVNRSNFTLQGDRAQLRAYESSPGKKRYFCATCGAPLYSELAPAGPVRIRAGSLDAPACPEPQGHIFAGSKAPWHEITDDLPRYPGREPGRGR